MDKDRIAMSQAERDRLRVMASVLIGIWLRASSNERSGKTAQGLRAGLFGPLQSVRKEPSV